MRQNIRDIVLQIEYHAFTDNTISYIQSWQKYSVGVFHLSRINEINSLLPDEDVEQIRIEKFTRLIFPHEECVKRLSMPESQSGEESS